MYDSYRCTTIQYHAEYTCSANHSVSSSHRHCTRKDRSIYTNKQTNRHWLEKTSTIQIQCRSAPPLPQSTSRTVSGHWLERTRTIQTVSICPPFYSPLRALSSNTGWREHSTIQTQCRSARTSSVHFTYSFLMPMSGRRIAVPHYL